MIASPIVPSIFLIPVTALYSLQGPIGQIATSPELVIIVMGGCATSPTFDSPSFVCHASWWIQTPCWLAQSMLADQAVTTTTSNLIPSLMISRASRATLARYENTTSTKCGTEPALVPAVRRPSFHAQRCLCYRGHPSPLSRNHALFQDAVVHHHRWLHGGSRDLLMIATAHDGIDLL